MSSENTPELIRLGQEVKIQIGESQSGKPCVKMVSANEKEWILVTSKTLIKADQIARQMTTDFGIPCILGPAIDWRESLELRQIVLIKLPENKPNVIGIYVEAEKFDKVLNQFSGSF